MPRIRTIKPDLAKHEGLFDAEQESGLPIRYVWSVLPCFCDREGRFEWRPRRLKAEIMPFDDVDFEKVLSALHSGGFVHRYQAGGKDLGCIPTFLKHQVINTREAKSELPPPEDDVMVEADPSRHIPAHVQRHVRARDNDVCRACGETEDLHFDHIVPFSKGGGSGKENIQLLCRKCNLLKSDKELVHAHDEDSESHVHARGERKGREGKGKEGKEDTDAPESASSNSKKNDVPRPDDIDEQTWSDFLAHRRQKKAKLTPSAWKQIRKQIDQGIAKGHDPNDMLAVAMAAGWQGFEFEWYLNRIGKQGQAKQSADKPGKNNGMTEAEYYLRGAY